MKLWTRMLPMLALLILPLLGLAPRVEAVTVLGHCDGCATSSVQNRGRSLAASQGRLTAGTDRVLLYDAHNRRLWQVDVVREYDYELRRWLTFAYPAVIAHPDLSGPIFAMADAFARIDQGLAAYSGGLKRRGAGPPRVLDARSVFGPDFKDWWTGAEISSARVFDLGGRLSDLPPVAGDQAAIQSSLQLLDQAITRSASDSSNETVSGGIDFRGLHVDLGVGRTIGSGHATTTRVAPRTDLRVRVRLWGGEELLMRWRPEQDDWKLEEARDLQGNILPFDENGNFRQQLIPSRIDLHDDWQTHENWTGISSNYGLSNLLGLILACIDSDTCAVVFASQPY